MAGVDFFAHVPQVCPAAAADVEYVLIAAPVEKRTSPSGAFGVALVHAREHLLAGCARRFGRIALGRNFPLLCQLVSRHIRGIAHKISSFLYVLWIFTVAFSLTDFFRKHKTTKNGRRSSHWCVFSLCVRRRRAAANYHKHLRLPCRTPRFHFSGNNRPASRGRPIILFVFSLSKSYAIIKQSGVFAVPDGHQR